MHSPLTRFQIGMFAAGLLLAAPLVAQRRGGGPPPPPPPRGPSATLHMPPGRWWDDAQTATRVGLTADQIPKMDAIFDRSRDRLIDLDGAVRKAEGALQTLLQPPTVDRAATLAAIHRLTEARAALDEANAEMLLDIRIELTPAEWTKLESLRPPRPAEPPGN